ncbi:MULTISPECIES: hypothetical protein [unclassified Microbacterium]|uniref:hypothetical protein n=1 Tax=unclassified Microbacterium TaxID=2609290 RepID=UPI00049351BB|nr:MULTISPECIES: hypothetical protein [unclassified Microbacterium]
MSPAWNLSEGQGGCPQRIPTGISLNLRANLQIARSHDAPPSRLAALDAEVRRLADAARDLAQLAEELSSRLD